MNSNIVCTAPGNPTGAYLAQAELEAIDHLCAANGLALVVDEVFAESYAGTDAVVSGREADISFAGDTPDLPPVPADLLEKVRAEALQRR